MTKIVFTIVLFISSFANAIPTGPVMVGGSAHVDACGGWGIATVSTTLFTTNDQGYSEFKKVEASQGVIFCDYKKDGDGEYYGVVIPKKGVDCGVSGPIEDKQAYQGKCESGWVIKDYLLLIAG